MTLKPVFLPLLAAILLPTMAFAQGAPAPVASIPLALAHEAAQAAITDCIARGWQVGVTVVDAKGNARLVEVADGAGAMTAVYSGYKAKTATLLNESTGSLKEKAKTDPAVAQKVKDNGNGDSAGGYPLMKGGVLVGGIGVGGARGDQFDEMCVLAGINKIKDRLK